MTFSRLLPLLMLIPALSMADEDRNFKLTSENFKVGSVLEHASKKAIALDSMIAISQEPVFPLQANQFYLRHKKSAKEYEWYSGDIKQEDYKKLHAFCLKENHLGVREVFGLRLYASRQYKAFQDEADIYFDTDYIYSPRVPKLLFMKNGKWQTLKECVHPGMVQIQSDEKKLDVVAINASVKAGAKFFYPMKAGAYIFSFSAPEKLPYVDIDILKPGEVLTFNVNFPVPDSGAATQVELSIPLDSVRALKSLEDVESVYDVFSAEVDRNFSRIDTTAFAKFYPAMKPADSLGIADSSKDYRSYVSQYKFKRNEALTLWRNVKLGMISEMYKAFRAKFDSLQTLPGQIEMNPVIVKKIRNATDSSKIDSLELHFGADHNRIEVSWKGVITDMSMEALATLLTAANNSVVTTLFLANNKPAWVFKEGKLMGRYHYRYENIGFRVGEKLYLGKGEFILPKHIAIESEVVEWLKSRTRIPESSSSAIASSSSMVEVVDTAKATPAVKIIEHATRGTVAIIDSGTFRYRGKVVSMSPYAIHTTEVTQDFFHKIMGLLDSAKRIPDRSAFKGANKPVQGITWEKAQYACKVLGGDLPTEAQWEYAGRAGSNDGVLWAADDAMSVGKYAIFADNSLKSGKKSDAYGPHDVATKAPNAWGLYDMSGNVAEWTRDNYFAITFTIESKDPTGSFWGTNKILKGGSWKDKVKKLNMTVRDDEDPRYWSDNIGFRCVFPLERIIQENKK